MRSNKVYNFVCHRNQCLKTMKCHLNPNRFLGHPAYFLNSTLNLFPIHPLPQHKFSTFSLCKYFRKELVSFPEAENLIQMAQCKYYQFRWATTLNVGIPGIYPAIGKLQFLKMDEHLISLLTQTLPPPQPCISSLLI